MNREKTPLQQSRPRRVSDVEIMSQLLNGQQKIVAVVLLNVGENEAGILFPAVRAGDKEGQRLGMESVVKMSVASLARIAGADYALDVARRAIHGAPDDAPPNP